MRQTPGHHRGFTLIELCLAMLVTSLVMGAMAAFSMALVGAWRASDAEQTLTLTGAQASARIETPVTKSRQIGGVRAGKLDDPSNGAAVMLWASDTNADGKIQGAEAAMIIHDPVADEIRYYPPGQGDAATVISWSTFTNSSIFENFATGRTSYALARKVTGANFDVVEATDTAQRPMFRYSLRIVAIDGSQTREMIQYGCATVRAPLAQP